MQNLDTGKMTPLEIDKFIEDIPKMSPEDFQKAVGNAEGKLAQALQAAKDKAQPDRAKQGPVFFEGEILEIKGGLFKVVRITQEHIKLKGLLKR